MILRDNSLIIIFYLTDIYEIIDNLIRDCRVLSSCTFVCNRYPIFRFATMQLQWNAGVAR